jgi:hypothetical protein
MPRVRQNARAIWRRTIVVRRHCFFTCSCPHASVHDGLSTDLSIGAGVIRRAEAQPRFSNRAGAPPLRRTPLASPERKADEDELDRPRDRRHRGPPGTRLPRAHQRRGDTMVGLRRDVPDDRLGSRRARRRLVSRQRRRARRPSLLGPRRIPRGRPPAPAGANVGARLGSRSCDHADLCARVHRDGHPPHDSSRRLRRSRRLVSRPRRRLGNGSRLARRARVLAAGACGPATTSSSSSRRAHPSWRT